MEEYASVVILTVMSAILAVLIRSVTKMYERLWTNGNKNGGNPEEMYRIVAEAVNEANKLSEDRQRKRLARASTPSPAEQEEEGQPLPGTEEELQGKINQLFEVYKNLS